MPLWHRYICYLYPLFYSYFCPFLTRPLIFNYNRWAIAIVFRRRRRQRWHRG